MDQQPFADVVLSEEGFSLPELKWRELLFIGALRAEGLHFVRDSSRPMPAFERSDLFPPGARFEVRKAGGRVHLRKI